LREIKQGSNRFYIGDSEDSIMAEITFKPTGDNVITIDHTYVAPELRGQGIAKKLLDRLVTWARTENKKIIPICSYAKQQMENNDEYHDILYH